MKTRFAFFLITFLLLATCARAQTSFTILVGTTPVNVTTTVPNATTVEIWQTSGNSSNYFVADASKSGQVQQIQPGGHYTFSQANGFPAGAVVGTVYLANGNAVQFNVLQSGAGGGNLQNPTLVTPNTCPTGQVVGAITQAGLVICVSASGTAAVNSVFGRSGNVVAAANDYNFNQLAGNIGISQMNSGTGASASTFWRGDGTWATPAGGAGTVTSVFGRTGAVTAGANDYTFGQLAGSLNLATQVTGLLAHANIATTAVTPGNYTNANITVAADGTLTAAANGTAGASSFATLTGGTNTSAALLVGSGATLGATGSGTIAATVAPWTGITGFPAGCGTNLFVTGVGSTLACTQPAFSNLSGTVALGSQVSGNLPVANLNSGTSASSTTFWRGDGTWAAPPATSSQVNGVALLSPSPINFQSSGAFNGLTATFTNGSAGNVTLGFSGTLGNAGLTNSTVSYNGQIVSLGLTGNVNSGAATHSVALNEGSGLAISGVNPTATNQVLTGASSADPSFKSLGDLTPTTYVAGGGSAQAQNVNLSPAATALTPGLEVRWLPVAANTNTAPTLSVNGLSATPITKLGTTPLIANDLTTSAIADAIFDGTEWQLQNPQTSSVGITGTVSANNVVCGTGTTSVGNCPDITDVSGAPTITGPLTLIGGGSGLPYSSSVQEGNPANCLSPTTGLDSFCANSTTHQLYLANGANPYGAITTQGLLNGLGLNNVLNYAPGVTISDGSAHTISTAPSGTIFSGITTLSALSALTIPGISGTPFSWITSAPFNASGGVYTIGATNVGSGGTSGYFGPITATGGGCGVEPTFHFGVNPAGAIGAGTISIVDLDTRGSGCTSVPTFPTSASAGLSGAVITPTLLVDGTVGNIDIAWLAIEAALQTGGTYIPKGNYIIGSVMPLPLDAPFSNNTFSPGTRNMIVGEGRDSSRLVAGMDFGIYSGLLYPGDPSGNEVNLRGRYNGNQYTGDVWNLGLFSSTYASSQTPGPTLTPPVNMDGIAVTGGFNTHWVEAGGFNHDMNLIGDHLDVDTFIGIGGKACIFWAPPLSGVVADYKFNNINCVAQGLANFEVAAGATIVQAIFSGETYLNGAPYAFFGDAASGGGCTDIIAASWFAFLDTEFIGNAYIHDESGYSSASGGTYTDANKCRNIDSTIIHQWFPLFSNGSFLGGGRSRRAAIDVNGIQFEIQNILTNGGQFSPNATTAAPSGGAPTATILVNSGSTAGGGSLIRGNISSWIGQSGTLPLAYSPVAHIIPGGGSAILIEQTGQYKGFLTNWNPTTGYGTTTAGDIFGRSAFAVGPYGTDPTTPPICVVGQTGIPGGTVGFTSAAAVPCVTSGQSINIRVGWQGYNPAWKVSTGIGPLVAITSAGTGGTNGTYTGITATGGGCSTEPVINVVVTGGSISSVPVTNYGVGCGSAPSFSLASVTGLSGGSLTAQWPSASAVPVVALTDGGILGSTNQTSTPGNGANFMGIFLK